MRIASILLAASFLSITAHAQTLGASNDDGFDTPNTTAAAAPLPSNYKTIFENSDVLVMHVHYGAHEFVPMHDHPAFPTLFVYLNNSGEVDIIHAGPEGTVHRPPTHAGAFRIAPALAERHSIQSNSGTPSDFLRVEFKNLLLPDVPADGKRVPASATPGTHTDFANASLRIDRIVCTSDQPCAPLAITHRALLIALNQTTLSTNNTHIPLALGAVDWLTPSAHTTYTFAPGAQALLVTFLNPEAAKPASDKPCSF